MKFDISTIFWLFFIFAAIQPLLKKRFLVTMRQRLIGAVEKKRGSRVIVLIHRQETMSLLGFPIFRYIDIDDSEEVIRAIHMTDPDMPLELLLDLLQKNGAAETVYAEVLKRNMPSLRFLRRLGFEVCSRYEEKFLLKTI